MSRRRRADAAPRVPERDVSDVVARGYDEVAERYAAWRAPGEGGDPTIRYLETLSGLLPRGGEVLELGCGAGVATRTLAELYSVTALDISATQVALARRAVPGATVERGDLLEASYDAGSFDAVVAFYVLNHVPRDRLAEVVDGVAHWLRPAGIFLASFGVGDVEAWVGRWLGTEMFFSSWPPERNSAIVEAAGLELVSDELVTIVEQKPEPGEATFQWILARR